MSLCKQSPIRKGNSFVSAKRITQEEREAIIRDIKARKQSYRRIADKHQVSIATVSKLAEREGLRRPRKTTPKTTPLLLPQIIATTGRRGFLLWIVC